jgi:hypothetical protein
MNKLGKTIKLFFWRIRAWFILYRMSKWLKVTAKKMAKEDDKEWEAFQKNFREILKKDHKLLYIGVLVEPYLFWIGTICFFVDPLFNELGPQWLWFLSRGLSSIAIGMGITNRRLVKQYEKENFQVKGQIINEINKLLKQIPIIAPKPNMPIRSSNMKVN